jgi:iron complex outermembrane receptor protein
MMKTNCLALFTTTAISLVLTMSPAAAAAFDGSAAQPPADTQEAAAAAAAAAADQPDELDEILVTAQRRSERLVDVPIAVTSLSSEQLQQNVIISSSDLTVAVPGLNFGRSTNFSQPTIRGVGSRNASSGDEPNVASFMDGVYLPDMTGTLFELSNIQGIEVLRGPQGTLFGRNATGGAININTRRPTSTPEAAISATIGEFGYYRVAAYGSGPIIGDAVTASLSITDFDDNGYIDNLFNGRTQGASGGTVIRLRTRYEVSDDLEFELNGFWSRSHNNVLLSGYAIGGNTQARNSIPGGPNAAVLNPTNIPSSQLFATQPFTTATSRDPFGRTSQQFVDGHMSWDLGFATLSGYASTGKTETTTLSWTDVSPLELSQTEYTSLNEFRNQELVLTSNPGSQLNWLVGFTGFQSDASFSPLRSTGRSATTGVRTPTVTFYGQNTEAFAVFGEATWQPVENLYLTGGLRYNRDDKDAFNLNGLTNVRTEGAATFENWSPRAVARWEFVPDSSIYASFTRGFKSGTFNAVGAAGTQRPASPELIDAYELGIKARLFEGVRVESALFHYDYTDLQVSTPVVINGVSATTVQNAGVATIDGVEATINADVTDRLTLFATVALLKTQIDEFPNASVQLPRLVNGVPALNGNVASVVNVSGNELIRAPDSTFSVGATYRHPLAGGELTWNATAFFSSSYWFDLTNRLSQPAYEVVNASITWHANPDGRGFYASVFAQNLTDQAYAAGFIISSFVDGTQVNKPRWFGATIGVAF